MRVLVHREGAKAQRFVRLFPEKVSICRQEINFGKGMWGPYITADYKYLFYTTGTKPDYSDV